MSDRSIDSEKQFSKLQGEPVLVTGATGFVGGFLTRKLLQIGAKVRILVREGRKEDIVKSLQNAGAEVVYGDVTDRESVFRAVRGCEYVFNIAALFREAKHPDRVYYDVNVEGPRNVLDAAEEFGVRRVIHCSTIGVHSDIPNPPANESEPYRPGDVYQDSKCEGEKLAKSYMERGRVEVVIVRPAMIWGEGDTRILKLFKGVKRRRFPIVGDGQTLTHWIYVHDLVDGFLLVAVTEQAAGQTYIFAGRRAVTIEELVNTVARKAETKPLSFHIPAKPLQIAGTITEKLCQPFGIEPPIYRRRVDFFTKNRYFDTSKAQKELGFQPKQDFEVEVSNIYEWYKSHELL